MKLIPVIIFCLLIAGCKTKPFLQSKLSFEKLSDNCSGAEEGIKMNSNLNGERYEFQRCLDTDFDKEKMISERKGDTVVISFPRKNAKQSLFGLTLDIDTYPRYNFLTIDGATIPIIPVDN